MTAPTTERRSIWHRAVAPECHVHVWRIASPKGVAHEIGVEGDDLERLEPEQVTMLAGVLLLAGKFARREQDLVGAGRRGRRS